MATTVGIIDTYVGRSSCPFCASPATVEYRVVEHAYVFGHLGKTKAVDARMQQEMFFTEALEKFFLDVHKDDVVEPEPGVDQFKDID